MKTAIMMPLALLAAASLNHKVVMGEYIARSLLSQTRSDATACVLNQPCTLPPHNITGVCHVHLESGVGFCRPHVSTCSDQPSTSCECTKDKQCQSGKCSPYPVVIQPWTLGDREKQEEVVVWSDDHVWWREWQKKIEKLEEELKTLEEPIEEDEGDEAQDDDAQNADELEKLVTRKTNAILHMQKYSAHYNKERCESVKSDGLSYCESMFDCTSRHCVNQKCMPKTTTILAPCVKSEDCPVGQTCSDDYCRQNAGQSCANNEPIEQNSMSIHWEAAAGGLRHKLTPIVVEDPITRNPIVKRMNFGYNDHEVLFRAADTDLFRTGTHAGILCVSGQCIEGIVCGCDHDGDAPCPNGQVCVEGKCNSEK